MTPKVNKFEKAEKNRLTTSRPKVTKLDESAVFQVELGKENKSNRKSPKVDKNSQFSAPRKPSRNRQLQISQSTPAPLRERALNEGERETYIKGLFDQSRPIGQTLEGEDGTEFGLDYSAIPAISERNAHVSARSKLFTTQKKPKEAC